MFLDGLKSLHCYVFVIYRSTVYLNSLRARLSKNYKFFSAIHEFMCQQKIPSFTTLISSQLPKATFSKEMTKQGLVSWKHPDEICGTISLSQLRGLCL